MSVHFTCPSKRHSDPYMLENGIRSTSCRGHHGPCQTLGERRPNRARVEERIAKTLRESSDMELVAAAAKYNLKLNEIKES